MIESKKNSELVVAGGLNGRSEGNHSEYDHTQWPFSLAGLCIKEYIKAVRKRYCSHSVWPNEHQQLNLNYSPLSL